MEESLNQEEMQAVWDEEVKASEAVGSDPAPKQDASAPDEDPQPIVQDPATPAVEVDPFASLPEAVRAKLARIDAIEESNAQLMHSLKSTEGRVAAMQRASDAAQKAQQSVAPGQAPTDGQIASAVQNPEEWDSLQRDYPEFATAMDKKLKAELAGLRAPQGLTPEQVSEYVRQQTQANQVEVRRMLQEARIEGKYEDWQEVVKTTDFDAWFKVQQPEVRQLANSDSAKDAIRMLDLFHEAKAKPADVIKQERGARLAAAAAPAKGGNAPPPKSLDDMSPAQLWEYEAKQREKTRAARGY